MNSGPLNTFLLFHVIFSFIKLNFAAGVCLFHNFNYLLNNKIYVFNVVYKCMFLMFLILFYQNCNTSVKRMVYKTRKSDCYRKNILLLKKYDSCSYSTYSLFLVVEILSFLYLCVVSGCFCTVRYRLWWGGEHQGMKPNLEKKYLWSRTILKGLSHVSKSKYFHKNWIGLGRHEKLDWLFELSRWILLVTQSL